MSRALRIALGSLFTESNHLGGRPTDLASFARWELRRGEEVLSATEGTLGGCLQALRAASAEVVPLLAASTCPGGPLTAACYDALRGELLERLRAAGPLDGVLLALHGAAAAENAGDLEGDLLGRVRELVGPRTPIVATLDLHAHVTQEMTRAADGLVAWETYPHKDAYATGQRGAQLLWQTLSGHCRPCLALARVPVLVSGVHGHTEGPGPFADVMRLAISFRTHPRVLSTSAFLVHPYLDLPGMGGGGLVITDGDCDLACDLAAQLAQAYWERRAELEPQVFAPAEAIRLGLARNDGPLLLVETADCCGGGAAGDSVATLRALLDAPLAGQVALAPVVDPAAAQTCRRAGVGGEVALRLGHALDPQWGSPLEVRVRVERLCDGQFVYTGGIWAGQAGAMGPTAVVSCGSVRVLIASQATYDWADEQYRAAGLDPAQAKFVVVKNPMNYRLGYANVARGAYLLDTPGPTPATLRNVAYQRLQRPYFPADLHWESPPVRVLRGRGCT